MKKSSRDQKEFHFIISDPKNDKFYHLFTTLPVARDFFDANFSESRYAYLVWLTPDGLAYHYREGDYTIDDLLARFTHVYEVEK